MEVSIQALKDTEIIETSAKMMFRELIEKKASMQMTVVERILSKTRIIFLLAPNTDIYLSGKFLFILVLVFHESKEPAFLCKIWKIELTLIRKASEVANGRGLVWGTQDVGWIPGTTGNEMSPWLLCEWCDLNPALALSQPSLTSPLPSLPFL